jgi:uncharacterized protein YfcZ (UPF0381/DUF406 family)
MITIERKGNLVEVMVDNRDCGHEYQANAISVEEAETLAAQLTQVITDIRSKPEPKEEQCQKEAEESSRLPSKEE